MKSPAPVRAPGWDGGWGGEHSLQVYRSNKVKRNTEQTSGAILTDADDPYDIRRTKIAKDYYAEVLGRNKEYEIKDIAANTNFAEGDVRTVYEHNFGNGHFGKFDPDYYMSLSWQRLRNAKGRDIQDCDIVMLHHELEEAKIMNGDASIDYHTAHVEAAKKYDFEKALNEYLHSGMD